MWYRKAAEQGYADAQYNLGILYANGQGVTQDYAEAARWYRKAADQGDAIAQINLDDLARKAQGAGARRHRNGSPRHVHQIACRELV